MSTESETTPTAESMETTTTAMETTDNEMSSTGDNCEDDRKLFVGGLPQDAKEADIKEHFSKFGEIDSVNLKTDPSSGRSRGFAFVVFKTTEGLEGAVANNGAESHVVKSKKVAVKKAQAKQGKVYVGKLKAELSDEEIKTHFAAYGTIVNVEQPFDKQKNERKNFCFITFDKEEPAKKLLKEGTVTLNGHELEIKKVTPKNDGGRQQGFNGGRGGGRGGGNNGAGGPWGGYGGSWGGYEGYWGSGYGGYGADPYYGGWGGYGGGGWGGYNNGGANGQAAGYAGGKTPRGGPRGGGQARGGGGRGGGGARGAQRQKPY